MAKERKQSIIVDLLLHGRKPDEEPPDVALYLIGPEGTPSEKLAAAKEGKLELQEAWKKTARLVALGPDVDDLRELRGVGLLRYRLADVWSEWLERETIDLARDWWIGWLRQRICVSGSVKRCFRWPWHFIEPIRSVGGTTAFSRTSRAIPGAVLPSLPRIPRHFPPTLLRCRPLCDGVVEVYERVCCCSPWIVLDPRLDELLRRLRELVKPPWPPPPPPIGPFPDPEPGPFPGPIPGPGPDPAPIDLPSLGNPSPGQELLPWDRPTMRQFKLAEALTDQAAVAPPSTRLIEDLHELEMLPREEASRYVMARLYLPPLLCTCTLRKVGEAVLRPDGSFTFCYWRPIRFFRLGQRCTTTYAYKVRQWQENQWVDIYDGLAAHEYFAQDEVADLTTSSLRARPCGESEPPPIDHPKPFVMLQEIGSTDSHHLVSPVQLQEDGINDTLDPNAGLVFPPGPGLSAVGRLLNRPWSRTLRLRLYVHPGMEGLGAHYYRISIVAADSQGNPASGATPQPLNHGVSWRRFVYVGGQVQVQGESLGPHVETDSNGDVQSGLYEIPYWDAAHLWLHGQFHHSWNTLNETNGRHLVLLEIFDQNGDRLRPTGATGDGIDKDFDFLHWDDPVNTSSVSYASLVHIFWVDKQPVYADIEDLRKDGLASAAECQFLTGTASSTVSAGFRAFHANGPSGEPFLWYYHLWYHRGLNGPNLGHESSGENAPPTLNLGPPAVSAPMTFGDMLAGLTPPKCSFALNLRAYAKHTNGSDRIRAYDRRDQAAFALEIA